MAHLSSQCAQCAISLESGMASRTGRAVVMIHPSRLRRRGGGSAGHGTRPSHGLEGGCSVTRPCMFSAGHSDCATGGPPLRRGAGSGGGIRSPGRSSQGRAARRPSGRRGGGGGGGVLCLGCRAASAPRAEASRPCPCPTRSGPFKYRAGRAGRPARFPGRARPACGAVMGDVLARGRSGHGGGTCLRATARAGAAGRAPRGPGPGVASSVRQSLRSLGSILL